MGRYWFRPKSFGYGATPISWEGWVFTVGSAIVTVGEILTIIVAEARHWPDRRWLQGVCFILLLATLVATIAISRNKTNGDWRWRP